MRGRGKQQGQAIADLNGGSALEGTAPGTESQAGESASSPIEEGGGLGTWGR